VAKTITSTHSTIPGGMARLSGLDWLG